MRTYPIKVLWATKKGAPDSDEQIITEREERIKEASAWATANGYDRLRVATIDLSAPPEWSKVFSI